MQKKIRRFLELLLINLKFPNDKKTLTSWLSHHLRASDRESENGPLLVSLLEIEVKTFTLAALSSMDNA